MGYFQVLAGVDYGEIFSIMLKNVMSLTALFLILLKTVTFFFKSGKFSGTFTNESFSVHKIT